MMVRMTLITHITRVVLVTDHDTALAVDAEQLARRAS